MNGEVRAYEVVGRATRETSSDKEATTYSPEMLTRIVREPGTHQFRIQIAGGEYFNAIKLHPGDVHRLRRDLQNHSKHEFKGDGQVYVELSDGTRARRTETEYVFCRITPYENRGLEIQIGGSPTCGAEAILTPKQRDDFERVLDSFNNNQNGFTPLFDNGNPQIVAADGEFNRIGTKE